MRRRGAPGRTAARRSSADTYVPRQTIASYPPNTLSGLVLMWWGLALP